VIYKMIYKILFSLLFCYNNNIQRDNWADCLVC